MSFKIKYSPFQIPAKGWIFSHKPYKDKKQTLKVISVMTDLRTDKQQRNATMSFWVAECFTLKVFDSCAVPSQGERRRRFTRSLVYNSRSRLCRCQGLKKKQPYPQLTCMSRGLFGVQARNYAGSKANTTPSRRTTSVACLTRRPPVMYFFHSILSISS